ncbi:MAG: sugar kinase [Actinomycetia bacterium]|nr:sugar kinase [Actinomycetes bacterium]
MAILVVGSVALDSIKTPFGKVEETLGGSATHFSCSASFFSPVEIVAVVGNDFPLEHIEFLKSRGIETSGLQIVEGKTFRWKGLYEYDMNQAQTLDTRLNVFEHFHPDLSENHKANKYIFLANIDPELQLEVLSQCPNPKLTVCDTMNYWIENKREALLKTIRKTNIVLINDSEARELMETFSLLEASKKILSLGPEFVILKKGEHGALMFTKNSHFSAPALPLENVMDPTGAGDSFAGGFLGFLSMTDDISEENIRKAVIYGSIMASFNVEGFGLNRLKSLTEKDISRRYNHFKELTRFE